MRPDPSRSPTRLMLAGASVNTAVARSTSSGARDVFGTASFLNALRAFGLACGLTGMAVGPALADGAQDHAGFRELRVAPGTAESVDLMELIRPFLMIDPLQLEGSPSLDLQIRQTENGYSFDVMTGGAVDDFVTGQHFRGGIIRYEGDRWLLIDLFVRNICKRNAQDQASASDGVRRDGVMKEILHVVLAGLLIAACLQPSSPTQASNAIACNFAAENMPEEPSDDSKAIAEATVRAWINCMGDRSIVIPPSRLSMSLVKHNAESSAVLPYHMTSKGGLIHLTIGLKRRIRPSMSAESINAAIAFIAIDGFPMPGLVVRHWRLKGLTRSSRPKVDHGVLAVDGTGIVLEMEMEIFTIYGLDTRKGIIHDKPTEPHTLFSINVDKSLKLTVRLDIKGFAG